MNIITINFVSSTLSPVSMNKIIVYTDLHCANCIAKVKPHLDRNSEIRSWSTTTSGSQIALTVEGENLNTQSIHKMLQIEGYSVITKDSASKENSFWNDSTIWKRASFNTLNCLIGCSIGDFAMIIYLQAFHPNINMLNQMILAICAGLCTSITLESVLLKLKEGFNWSMAVKTALGMSFISMVGMELAMNTTDFMITGGKAAFNDAQYWLALVPALVAGFLTPLPYNYYKLKKYNKACH